MEEPIIDYEQLQREQLLRKLSESVIAVRNTSNLDVSGTIKAIMQDLSLLVPESDLKDEFFWRPSQLSDLVVQYIIERRANPGLPGFDTGFSLLNNMIGGWEKKHIYTLNAKPGSGKTTIMLQWLWILAQQTPVVLFSPEARAEMLSLKLMSALSHTPVKMMRRGNVDDNQFQLIERGAHVMKSRPLYIIDLPEINSRQMQRYLNRVEQEVGQKIQAIGVDYLQQMTGEDSFQVITNNMKDLETFVIRNDVTCILASQVGRAVGDASEQTAGKGSGKIEELSSCVFGLLPVKKGEDGEYTDKSDKDRRILVCSKNRMEGDHFKMGLRFNPITNFFEEEEFGAI